MLLFYIRKAKKELKQLKAKVKLSPKLEKERRDLLFACFEIMLSNKHGGKLQDGKGGAKPLQYFSVDDLFIINYDEDRK